MPRLPIVLLVAAALAIAGCGGNDTATPGTTDAAAEGKAGAATVGMKGIAFQPKKITVKVGQKITWTNNEDIPHNVTAEEGAEFQSDTFGKDGTFSYTSEKAGVIEYTCTIHPGMDGTITVEK